MKYFFSYGDDNFRLSKKRIYHEAVESGFFDVVRIHGPEDLPDTFKKKFQDILKKKRGGGYWIWKLFFINEYLHKLDEGDFLIYADAGSIINKYGKKRFQEYLKMLEKSDYGFLSLVIPKKENQWTIKELYDHFGLSHDDSNINNNQYIGGFIIAKKCSQSMMIMEEVMRVLYHDPIAITDDYNSHQDDSFIENRHDQSFMSLARKKYGSVEIHDQIDPSIEFLLRIIIGNTIIDYIKTIVDYFSPSPYSSQRNHQFNNKKSYLKAILRVFSIFIRRFFLRYYPFPFWAARIWK